MDGWASDALPNLCFHNLIQLCQWELSYFIDQANNQTDMDTNHDIDSIPDCPDCTPSQSTEHHSGSDDAQPHPAGTIISKPATSTCIPHPNYPYGIYRNGVPYFLEHYNR